MDTKGSNIVFLLCVPRSGSSLTTCMLQNHSQVFATQEMWFLMSLHDLRLKQRRPYGGSSILHRFYNGVLTEDMFLGACRAFALQVYHDLLQSSGGRLIVDKSPRYYYMLEFLDRLFPESRRIMLVRNPLDIASSYKKIHTDERDRFDISNRLYHQEFDIRMTDLTVGLLRYADYFAEENRCAYRLSYERLVSNPQEQLKKLCEFLDIEYEEGMEKYGQFMNSSKSDLFFSMGVGDPMLADHQAPHVQSVNRWHEVLSVREVELICRALGAGLFHRLGYAEELAHAERMTGIRFDREPDKELLGLRAKQLQELTGCQWEPAYRMRIEDADSEPSLQGGDAMALDDERPSDSTKQELLRLQITLQAVESRLQHAYEERDYYKKRHARLQDKVNRVKSWIPFGGRLAKWAGVRLGEGGKRL